MASFTQIFQIQGTSRRAIDLKIQLTIGLGVESREKFGKPYNCLTEFRNKNVEKSGLFTINRQLLVGWRQGLSLNSQSKIDENPSG